MQRMIADIEEIKEMTVEMSSLALSMLEESVAAMGRDDQELVGRMKESQARIVELDEMIESKAFRILMIYQPMSADMRMVAAILKMITYFERLGKYGYNISKYHIDMKDLKGSPVLKGISDMGKIALSMVKGTVDSFITEDISDLRKYGEAEDRLDALRKMMLNETLEFMKDRPDRVDDGNKIITVSRYLERAGDYACKLAEKITFMVSGERIEIG